MPTASSSERISLHRCGFVTTRHAFYRHPTLSFSGSMQNRFPCSISWAFRPAMPADGMQFAGQTVRDLPHPYRGELE